MQSHAVTTSRIHTDHPSPPNLDAKRASTDASYTALILRDGRISEVALNRSASHSPFIAAVPVDELQRIPCAMVVPGSDLNWWAICCASLRERGLIVQPFVNRDHACTWLWFMQAAQSS